MTRTAIGLGSNIEHRLSHLQGAVGALKELGEVAAVSSLYETEPIGGPRQSAYLNAVVILETDLSAPDLLAALHQIEQLAGRTREVQWGPRSLDLDLLLFGSEDHASPDLTVPHPRIGERRFVLEPLAQVWPDAPTPGSSPPNLLRALPAQELRLLAHQWATGSPVLIDRGGAWVVGQGVLFLLWLVTVVTTGRLAVPSAVRLWLGLAVTISGAVLVISSGRVLGRSLTPLPAPLADADLIETGPYSFLRHPMYTGVIITLAGVSLAAGSGLGLVLTGLILVFFGFKATSEERRLGLVYQGYSGYQARVPHRLIPGLW